MTKLYLYHQNRIQKIVNIILISGLIILSRFFYIQVLQANLNAEEISSLIKYRKVIKGERGEIYDRNGIPLAENITKGDFWVDTSKELDIEAIAKFFYDYFNLDSIETSLYLKNKKTNYLPIKKNVALENIEEINSKIKNIKGLNLDKYSQRIYRYGEICSHLLGYVDLEGNGKSGVEYQFDYILKGKKKSQELLKTIDNRLINKEKEKFNSKLYGKDISLTIDIHLQSILYNAIQKGQIESNSKSANGIILNPHTGEILAMAGSPSYDPNNYMKYNIKHFKNNSISEQYEPGSTIKVIPILDALSLEEKNKPLKFDCEKGEYKLPETNIIIHDHEPYEVLLLDEVLIYSSNIGVSKISRLLGKEKIYSSFRKFGIGTKTGIDLPGEEGGTLRDIKKWSRISHSMVSIGQEISVTNLQLAMIYAAIANNGYLLKPILIKKIEDSFDYNLSNTEVVRKVVSKEDSKKIINILTRAVNDGTGTNAKIPGYQIAGKTGTAEKFINGEYSERYFVSSFASIFPSESPEYVCIVSVDSPEYHKHWGNMTAAPIVQEIYKGIIENDFLLVNQEF